MMRLKYYDKTEFDRVATAFRSISYPNRKKFQPVNAETVIRTSKCGIDLRVEKLESGFLGKYYNKIITIDANHYDDEFGSNYTISHEFGHALFHSYCIDDDGFIKSGGLFSVDKRTYSNIEWQANTFAAALLIPKDEIMELHQERFIKLGLWGKCKNNGDELYRAVGEAETNKIIQEFANIFRVSTFIMAIRMKFLDILNMHGHSFIRYNSCSQVISGFI